MREEIKFALIDLNWLIFKQQDEVKMYGSTHFQFKLDLVWLYKIRATKWLIFGMNVYFCKLNVDVFSPEASVITISVWSKMHVETEEYSEFFLDNSDFCFNFNGF